MPLYVFQCTECSAVVEQLRSVDSRNAAQACPTCGQGQLARHVAAEIPAVPGSEIGFSPYFDPSVGKYIQDRATRDREWKARGLVGRTRKQQVEAFERNLEHPRPEYKPKPEAWQRAMDRARKRVHERCVIRLA